MSRAQEQDGDSASPRTYTLPELAEISGIDYRTLHNWQKRGLLRPSHQAANGSGTTNLFDVEDALQILVIAELRKTGVEIRLLEGIANELRRSVAGLQDEVLVVGESKVKILARPNDLEPDLLGSGPVLVYPAGRARELLAAYETAQQRVA